ncbi:hypothetical protein [Actinotalea sp.]|uniref:hypothetical protein n=1 Tax=Actinotalea sp. TaxID=1872145 RepID=UPI0035645DBD
MSGSTLALDAAPHRRALLLGVALSPVTVAGAWFLARPSGLMALTLVLSTGLMAAGVLGSYAPVGSRRPTLGCTPCAVAAVVTVPAAGLLLLSGRNDPSLLVIAFGAVAFGLAQRLRTPTECPTR